MSKDKSYQIMLHFSEEIKKKKKKSYRLRYVQSVIKHLRLFLTKHCVEKEKIGFSTVSTCANIDK